MSLYHHFFYCDEITELFSDETTVQFMLDFEANLALAQAKNGLFDISIAQNIIETCKVQNIDIQTLKKEINDSANAAIPLVKQLGVNLKNNYPEAAKYVHLGATSQDVVDTASVLQIKSFLEFLETKIDTVKHILIELTKKHRNSIMIGRTLLQHAKPITFGLKTALWLENIYILKQILAELKPRLLKIQLSGAVGSGNDYINLEVKKTFAQLLGLSYANSWHSSPISFVEFGSFLGLLNGSLAKIAKDITLLMQTEIGEVYEGTSEGKGTSSTMPHKRNPVSSVAIIANASRTPHLVSNLMALIPQEQERSPGMWHGQWEVMTELLQLTAGSVIKSIDLLTNIEVNKVKMAENINLTNGLIFAENVSLALSQKIGKNAAHTYLEKACEKATKLNKNLKQILIEYKIDLDNLDNYFLPENSIGNSLAIIDEILLKNEL